MWKADLEENNRSGVCFVYIHILKERAAERNVTSHHHWQYITIKNPHKIEEHV